MVAAALLAGGRIAGAQVRVVAGGRVLRAGATDSVPLAQVRVTLHRVGREEQGPLDSVLTDAAGRFRFRFLADTTAVYLLSARHAGITYFAPPVHTNPERPDTGIRLVVSDTSSAARVTIEARHIVISAPGADGTRNVVEVVILHNDGWLTAVAADTTRPVWGLRLPPAASGLTAGEGDFPESSIARRGDSLALMAPVAPGEKQIVVQYAIPGDIATLTYPFDAAAGLVNVMLQERSARVIGALAERADSEVIQGRPFHRWEGAMHSGDSFTVHLPVPHRLGRWVLPAMVMLLGVGLALAGWLLATRRPATSSASSLLGAVARLDMVHAAGPDAFPPEEWTRYQEERARLKSLIAAALAAGGDVR
jgi:hypothetical protein